MRNLAYQLIKNYEKMPDKICLVEKNTQVTYAELYNLVANFKDNLKRKGIKQGDKVLVLVPMSIPLYVTLLSIWSLGAIPCFMDAGFIKNGLKTNEFNDINSIVGITKYILFYPLVLLAQYIIVLAISFVISSVTVYFRDLQHLIGVALQLLFYATPIVYAADTIPESFKWVLDINPMTYIINGYRAIFYEQQAPDLVPIFILIGVGILCCVIGYLIFNKLQKGFAEEL